MEYIDRDEAIRTALKMCVQVVGHGITQIQAMDIVFAFEDIPTAEVTQNIPCRVGDEVYAIRKQNQTWTVKQGKVCEMYFADETMRLCIVVKGVSRGEWGKVVFPTYEEAVKKLEEIQTSGG